MGISVSAASAARRALILAAVVCRASIDNNQGEPDAVALCLRIIEWLTELDLMDELEPDEANILRAPLGTLKEEEIIRATWYVEGLAILAWALKQLEFPRHDRMVDSYAVADSVWFLSDEAQEFIHNASLRDKTEMEAGHELLYAVHTRLRDFIRHRSKKDFASWIDKKWLGCLGIEETDLIKNNDLAIDNKPISDIEYERVQECASIAFERHRAILWLLEDQPSYKNTAVAT